jgi:hypothetical protein
MIELLRYARHKNHPKAPAMAAVEPDGATIRITFKRFCPMTTDEQTPEESLVTFEELERRLEEAHIEMNILNELLALKSK